MCTTFSVVARRRASLRMDTNHRREACQIDAY